MSAGKVGHIFVLRKLEEWVEEGNKYFHDL